MMLAKIDWDYWWADVAIKPVWWWLECPYFFMPRLAFVGCVVEVFILVLIFVVWRYNLHRDRKFYRW